jgi:tripartite ATP-independent transporter DctM subunit
MTEPPTGAPAASRPLPAWLRFLHTGENHLLALVLGGMVVLPLAEIFLRKLTGKGIAGSSAFVQHFTLLVGVLGGALAAREGRLLTLSSLPNLLKAPWKSAAIIFSRGVAAALSIILCVAGWQFVQAEPAGKILAYGIPYRAFQIFLPLGFATVALRLCWTASDRWAGRALALALAAVLVFIGVQSPIDSARLIWPALIALGVATVLGAPIFTILGGAAIILFWGTGRPVSIMSVENYYLVTDAVLPSLPLFTLAGYFLAESGASKRLVRVFQALFEQFRGGPGIVTVVVCAFFTSFTGASGVTILALGGLLMPILIQAKYSERTALGLVTGSGSLGMLFPPCLPLILYAVIAQRTIQNLELPEGATVPEVTINQLFLGGIGPGLLLVALTAWWAVRAGPKVAADRPKFDWREARAALWDAKWELFLPVVVMGVMFGGLATAVEAAAVAALYAGFTQIVIHRDLRPFKDAPRVMAECGMIIGGVLLILGVATGFTRFLIFEDVPTAGVEWIKAAIRSPWMFLLLLNLALFVVGCVMDIFSAIVVMVPLIVPMGLAFGIDPVHLGIVFLANLELGFLTPLVGVNLFLSSYRFNKPMSVVARAALPMMGVLAVGVILITYLPVLTTWLPQVIK